MVIRDGGLENYGNYVNAIEELIFSGSSADSILGYNIDAYSITIGNTGGIFSGTDTLISNYLVINSGSGLTIGPKKFLTVNYGITNNAGTAGFILKSDNSGSASVICNNTGIPATVEHFTVGDRWHILGSSTPGQSIISFLANNDSIPSAPTFRAMTYYDEPNGRWASYLTNSSPGNMEGGQGYLIRTTCDTALYFEGNLQGTALSGHPVSYLSSGWNSVGNPFPSSIKISNITDPVNNFLNLNSAQFDPEHVAVYIWDEQPGYSGKNRSDYVALNLLSDIGYLQPGQGFLVRSVTGGGLINFPTSIRAHHNSTVFTAKKSVMSTSPSIIKLHAVNGSYEAITSLYFVEDASEGLDPGYDAGLYGALKDFSLYSHLIDDTGNKFMIQALPKDDFRYMEIPIGFDCTEASNVVFSAENISLPGNFKIVLEDREKSKFTPLHLPGKNYSVDIEPYTSGIGRFYIHMTSMPVGEFENKDISSLNIYSSNGFLYINGDIQTETDLTIVDLMGRQNKFGYLEDSFFNEIDVSSLQKGVHIIVLTNSADRVVQKVVIR